MTHAKSLAIGGPASRKPAPSAVKITEDTRQRFAPHGVLALQPQAFGMLFECEAHSEPELTDSGVAVIDIHGPLMNHAGFFFDSYEAIKQRTAAAIALSPRAIVLAIDSPGGLVAGAFDTARELRAMAAAAQVDLRAHISGVGASAAYALASSASWIGVSQTAMVGSIGIIDTIVDQTQQNAMVGLNVQLIASGLRKTDGNPDMPITEGALKAGQERVNALAEMFFELVSNEHGWGGSVDDLRALQAGVFNGRQAVEMRLASEVATLDQTIDLATAGAVSSLSSEAETKGSETMSMQDAIDALREAAEGDNEDEAKKARKMLSALEDDDDTSAEGDDDDDTSAEGDDDEDKPEAKSAEGDDDDTSAEGDDDEDKPEAKSGAKASAKDIALRALAKVHNMEAAQKKEKRDRIRAELIASRDDLAPEMVALLQDRTTPLATVRKMVKTLKRGKPVERKQVTANAATAIGTRGENAGNDRSSRLGPDQRASLDAAMGLANTTTAIKHDGNRMIFGASVPKTQEGK